MSAKDKNSPIAQLMDQHTTDSHHNDNECNKRAVKFLRQNMENSADGSGCAGDGLSAGNCYRSILIDDDVDVDFKSLQMQNNNQGHRLKSVSERAEEERRKAVFHRTFCRESFVRKFPKTSLDNESYALLNLMFGMKRKSSTMYRNLCFFSVLFAFGLGLMLGSFIPFSYNYVTKDVKVLNKVQLDKTFINQSASSDNRTASPLQSDESFVDKNDTNSRVFIPHERNNLISINVGRSKGTSQIKRKKLMKLNRPKKFSSVSFVDDIEKIEKEDFANIDQKSIDGVNVEDILHGPVSDTSRSITDDIIMDENNIVYGNIFWGPRVEKSLPAGFGYQSNREWTDYMKSTSAIKMETGCGRMQNRLVTFLDGRQACVRYRQNTDQIQGELFSFYLAQLLDLPNLVPSLVSLVNLTDSLWQNVASDIGSAQWNSNRPVVMTRYIPNLESAHIPDEFKPSERHLNKHDVLRMIKGEAADDERPPKDGGFLLKKITEGLSRDEAQNELPSNETKEIYFESISEKVGKDTLDRLLELAQWSDLIVFDYLTANLDRIVNNLYNYQWNVNIMDAPAHNLAKKVDSNLLLFLDNESGLLHGYRLLHKYEIYHSLLLDNLCVFRKSTADAVQKLQQSGKVGDILNEMFKSNNGASVQDVLPPLPEKSVKILNERISRVAGQIKKCQEEFSAR